MKAADLVLTNGKIYTLDADKSWAEAVAVSGKKIIYIDSNTGANRHIGAYTELIDLNGKVYQAASSLEGFN